MDMRIEYSGARRFFLALLKTHNLYYRAVTCGLIGKLKGGVEYWRGRVVGGVGEQSGAGVNGKQSSGEFQRWIF